eukprot:TRINITY_DN8824_c0_g1_i1.p1 TRINITY_DN8824_c0_g1~~TRINITY_DN8824_c0_g1_i1.p1  ORF type:complete len:104 (-),score=19.19 TRINITY_DN8824_c0_g1_i1:4-315(-)
MRIGESGVPLAGAAPVLSLEDVDIVLRLAIRFGELGVLALEFGVVEVLFGVVVERRGSISSANSDLDLSLEGVCETSGVISLESNGINFDDAIVVRRLVLLAI